MSPSPRRPTLADRLQREWLTGGPLSAALLPLSWLYRGLLALRALAYRLRLKRTATLPVPVIVVGNWIVGGAGKTPTTLALLELLRARGLRTGVVSRGYGREGDGVHLITRASTAREAGDEPLLIHLRGQVPVAVGRDRVAAARALLTAHPELDLLVSDDGLQHWRLPRSLSLLVFDERGLGNGRLLPAGPLRQPPAALQGDQLVVYNAPAPSTPLPGFVAQRRLVGAVNLAGWWAGQPATLDTLHALRGRPGLLACAGLARPQRFFDMLTAQGLAFALLPLPDHADFSDLPWPTDAAGVLLTEKDAVKLPPERVGSTPVWVVTLDFAPGAAFEAAFDAQLTRLTLL
ncbi:tetraacyldisaccharide 4'-kinase [Roseateles asaccharophilus]|uniref:Tetraacyldisaccharide 4'-kinase n=1 Tax=Roseateles asaccharophilus TaxID=582607 RepID=A0ABU2A4L2_9BURK|nr:tetraacyldisaccharide 4'-kinase [Roseateles asaccharophilus]MDR7331940.1 tetraacyldisaccharide 4'-kinase [Roseateles asaccharophilus]